MYVNILLIIFTFTVHELQVCSVLPASRVRNFHQIFVRGILLSELVVTKCFCLASDNISTCINMTRIQKSKSATFLQRALLKDILGVRNTIRTFPTFLTYYATIFFFFFKASFGRMMTI